FMIIETKRKTQTVRLNFIRISLNLSVFFIYWLVFAQSRATKVIPKKLQTRYNKGVQAYCKARGEKYGTKGT
ncbi:hypothetical protein, partial [Streptococcus suis]|uniref:hypothetical protein n=1 Tax=Streptococcus suis TaxID=1307 RepID=UPI001EE71F50